MLEGYRGIVQCDGYAAYKKIAATPRAAHAPRVGAGQATAGVEDVWTVLIRYSVAVTVLGNCTPLRDRPAPRRTQPNRALGFNSGFLFPRTS
jgi:hypothetical protein